MMLFWVLISFHDRRCDAVDYDDSVVRGLKIMSVAVLSAKALTKIYREA
jgi:hypothetical protein